MTQVIAVAKYEINKYTVNCLFQFLNI